MQRYQSRTSLEAVIVGLQNERESFRQTIVSYALFVVSILIILFALIFCNRASVPHNRNFLVHPKNNSIDPNDEGPPER